MYKFTFILPGLPKTTNAISRAHWTVKVKEARKWHEAVKLATLGNRPKQPLECAKLTLLRRSSRTPDSDGLVSSFKHVIDGLRHAKVIVDDKYSNIGMPEYYWGKIAAKEGHIQVTIEEIF